MKNFLLSTAAIAVMAFSVSTAQAATTTGHATAVIESSITVTEAAAMSFGNFVIDNGATSAYVSSNPSVSPVDAVQLGTQVNGSFDVTGEAGLWYTFDVQDSVILENSSGDTVTAYLTGDASNTGTVNFPVIGLITGLASTQAIGAYNGEYSVTAIYQ